MLVKEIIQRVQSLYSKGVQSDDSRLTPRHIYSKILSLRSKYISQQAKKKQKINQWNFQTLPCVEVIKVPPSLCPCVPVPGCDILRTKYPLPKPLTDLNKHLIQSVTSLDGTLIFSEIQWDEVKYKASSKYTATKPDYFIDSGYLYIIGLTQRMRHLKTITITGLWEDPVTAMDYESVCEECGNKMASVETINTPIPIEVAERGSVQDSAKVTIQYPTKVSSIIHNDTTVYCMYDATSMSARKVFETKRNICEWYLKFRPEDPIYGRIPDDSFPDGYEVFQITEENLDTRAFPPTRLSAYPSTGYGNVETAEKNLWEIINGYGDGVYLKQVLDGTEEWLSFPERFIPFDVLEEMFPGEQTLRCTVGNIPGDRGFIRDERGKSVFVVIFLDEIEPLADPGYYDCIDNSQSYYPFGAGYHEYANSASSYNKQPSTKYKSDYERFTKIYPLFKSFLGILYPTTDSSYFYSGSFNHRRVFGGLQQQTAAVFGRPITQAESDYLGNCPTYEMRSPGYNWNDVKSYLKTANPYSTVLDSNGNPGLLQYNWRIFTDRNILDPVEAQQFERDISVIIEDINVEEIDEDYPHDLTIPYESSRYSISEATQDFAYEKENWDCCGEKIIETRIEKIPVTKYEILRKEEEKIHIIEVYEAYWDTSTNPPTIKERLVTKEVPYTEIQQELVERTEYVEIEIEEEFCECDNPSALEREFHIDADMLDYVVSEAAEELVTYYNQNREDLTNDTKDSIVEESK